MKVDLLKVADVVPSPDNNRHIEKKSEEWKSFVASIKAEGVIVPIKVRAKDGKYEIIYGQRRWTAAKEAGLELIPAIVVEATDEEARTERVLENLQRQDLTPIEEARQIQILIADGKNNEEIAARLGKSLPWVYQRANISTLHPEILKAKDLPKWSVQAMVFLALLPQEAQLKTWDSLRHFTPSADQVRNAVERSMRSLKDVAFSTGDDKLVEKAGACVTCPKRSGAQPDLFELTAKERKGLGECLDAACYAAKRKAHVAGLAASVAATGAKPVFVTEEYCLRDRSLVPDDVKDDEVLVQQEWRKATKKDSAKSITEVINIDTGRVIEAVLIKQKAAEDKPKTAKGRKLDPKTGKVVPLSDKEKAAQLHKRRVFFVLEKLHSILGEAKLSETTLKVPDVLRLIAHYGAGHGDYSHPIGRKLLEGVNAGKPNEQEAVLSTEEVMEYVWIRMLEPLRSAIHVQQASSVHPKVEARAKSFAVWLKQDWKVMLAEAIEAIPKPKSWGDTPDPDIAEAAGTKVEKPEAEKPKAEKK